MLQTAKPSNVLSDTSLNPALETVCQAQTVKTTIHY